MTASSTASGTCPYGLWLLGLGLDPQRPMAITGVRAATEYGVSITEDLAADLAVLGHTVVTSLAYGIDVTDLVPAMKVHRRPGLRWPCC